MSRVVNGYRTNCGGDLRIDAATTEQSVIEELVTHRGLLALAPPRVPAS